MNLELSNADIHSLINCVYFEANPYDPEEARHIVNCILARVSNGRFGGRNIIDVITAKGQFETYRNIRILNNKEWLPIASRALTVDVSFAHVTKYKNKERVGNISYQRANIIKDIILQHLFSKPKEGYLYFLAPYAPKWGKFEWVTLAPKWNTYGVPEHILFDEIIILKEENV